LAPPETLKNRLFGGHALPSKIKPTASSLFLGGKQEIGVGGFAMKMPRGFIKRI